MGSLSITDARRIFGARLLGPDHVAKLVGGIAPAPEALDLSAAEAEALAHAGCGLVYRAAETVDGRPITLARLHECTSADRSRGFRGEEPWFLDLPSALEETPEAGWAIFFREPWAETRNRTVDAGDAAMHLRAGTTPWRRRRSVEIALDCFMALAAGDRLLEHAWDWSATPSTDGGFLNLGGFGSAGMEVVAYSRPVKHDALGICPTLVPSARA